LRFSVRLASERNASCFVTIKFGIGNKLLELAGTGQAAPLFGLEDSLREVTMGRSFAELQELYNRMIWIDSRVEAEHFCIPCSRTTLRRAATSAASERRR
jgi:hypothetical protein